MQRAQNIAVESVSLKICFTVMIVKEVSVRNAKVVGKLIFVRNMYDEWLLLLVLNIIYKTLIIKLTH